MTLRKWILISLIFAMVAGCGGPWNSGDRVLVQKCTYDNGFTSPNRYDVVVFKYPKTPMDDNTPKNYIKRLLGLPGELLAIFFGRLYHWTPKQGEAPPFDDRNALDANGKKVNPNELWRDQFLHTTDEKTRKWFEEGKFEILRKPPHVMMALRRIVYDNDYQAADLKKINLHRWDPSPNGSWKNDQTTGFVNDGKSTDEVAWIHYQHLLRPDGALGARKDIEPMLILDTLDYNTGQLKDSDNARFFQDIYSYAHWVGDLMIECNVEVTDPKGEFWFELSKGQDRFQARWDLASGNCTLLRVGANKQTTELAVKTTRVKGLGNYMLRLANIDARLTVWVDGDLPFGDGKEYSPPEILSAKDIEAGLTWEKIESRRGPTKNDLNRPASIGSKGGAVKVTHLRLWRDTYYRTNTTGVDFKNHSPHNNPLRRDDWSKPERWDELRKEYDYLTMYVQPGHYLCLGDNSQASSDSRDWGLVPERLMLGRALLVYYPFDRVGRIR